MQIYLKNLLFISGVAACSFAAAALLGAYMGHGLLPAVQAAEEGGGHGTGSKGKGGKAGGKGSAGHGGAKHGGSSQALEDKIFKAGGDHGKSGLSGRGGNKRGEFGDLWVILRDANGAPILSAEGFKQPVDKNGNLIPLDSKGSPVDATLVQEVELSRLNVSRAPAQVLSKSLARAVEKIAAATTITLDAAGRVMVDGALIDSPLENLALYKGMMTNTLPDSVVSKLPPQLSAASLLAAAADKTSSINTDVVVNLNSMLGINAVQNGVTSYYAFTKNYDREASYRDATAVVRVLQADGSYKPETVNLYAAVFANSAWLDPTPESDGADDFAAAANDALRVIQFVHDNAVP